jgi:hypothetical protein
MEKCTIKVICKHSPQDLAECPYPEVCRFFAPPQPEKPAKKRGNNKGRHPADLSKLSVENDEDILIARRVLLYRLKNNQLSNGQKAALQAMKGARIGKMSLEQRTQILEMVRETNT